MSRVYMVGTDGSAESMDRVRCKDEDLELQRLLLRNPQLLPSEQIDPDNPPRWLLVKREMPVTDPASGAERWSIDFVYVDHMGIPTLVECKRCDDTRSRREVVAQMLEYAANGQHYWSAQQLLHCSQASAGSAEVLQRWTEDAGFESPEAFFQTVEKNLRESRMRLIFFLEESPNELRSLVDFLNRQLNATEVLLVEARQYRSAAGLVVVPWLFGFTEEARVAKRESRAAASGRQQRGEDAYWAAVSAGPLGEATQRDMEALINSFPRTAAGPLHWTWAVSALLLAPAWQKNRGVLGLKRSGELELFFNYWSPSKHADLDSVHQHFRDELARRLSTVFDLPFTARQLEGFPTIKPERWRPRIAQLVQVLKEVAGTAPPVAQADPLSK